MDHDRRRTLRAFWQSRDFVWPLQSVGPFRTFRAPPSLPSPDDDDSGPIPPSALASSMALHPIYRAARLARLARMSGQCMAVRGASL